MITNLVWLAVLALVVAGTAFVFHLNVTAGWAIVCVLAAFLGFGGFVFNANTPVQLGPLPFIFFVIAAIALIVVITRLFG
jgi:hypothetical protein